MALATDVQNRVNTDLLIALTNQGDRGASSVDTTVLGYAVADATAQFETDVGVEFDEDDDQHVAAGILGTLFYLHLYADRHTPAMQQAKELWEGRLDRARKAFGANRRMLPTSGSNLKASDQVNDTAPDGDRGRFQDVVPKLPGFDTDELVDEDGL